ncbi:hypothetical protein ACWGST_15520 [Agromyces sp. NPDC055520]
MVVDIRREGGLLARRFLGSGTAAMTMIVLLFVEIVSKTKAASWHGGGQVAGPNGMCGVGG